MNNTPKVGDILISSWGYDQTNVDFYKVLKISPSGKSVSIQRIKGTIAEKGGYMSGEATVAIPHEVAEFDNKVMTKLAKPNRDGYGVKIKNYAWAYLWDGKPHYCSWYA